uniref:Uncharacterized protein n=1 Tax=Nothoprocta perdicaria TaxID=30464 RepID=A0A8C6YJQ6_NOTPE
MSYLCWTKLINKCQHWTKSKGTGSFQIVDSYFLILPKAMIQKSKTSSPLPCSPEPAAKLRPKPSDKLNPKTIDPVNAWRSKAQTTMGKSS